MKKNKKRNNVSLIVLLLVLVLTVVITKNVSSICYTIAKNHFDNQKYAQSLTFFEYAIKTNPNDLDAYYYYAKALDKLPMSYSVQKKLFELANQNKSGAAASIANEEIQNYKQFILSHVGANYIQQVAYQNQILRWDTKKFPLKVYIEENSNLPNYYISNVRKAFKTWTEATDSLITFEFISSPVGADIDFKFINKDNTTCQDDGCQYVLAYAIPTVSGNKLKKFDIKFSTSNNLNQAFLPKEIYLGSMHEIGHALGIIGHSFYEENLMYPSSVEENPMYSKHKARGITGEDINTIRLLYAFLPDITNGTFSAEEQQRLIYPPIILGSEKEITNKKLEQAKKYIEQAPHIPVGYIDLAIAYYENGNYSASIKSLEKALELTQSDEAKFPILYNMTLAYFENRDYDNALIYGQMALNIKNTPNLNALVAYIKFNLGNKKFAIEELNTLLSQNPQNIDVARYLIQAYIDNKQYNEAGKILKRIKANNADAATDPRITQFGLLNKMFN